MSKYRNVIKAVFGNEWAILPEKMEQICDLLELRASGITLTREQIAGRVGLMDGPSDRTTGQIAVMNLYGTISQRMNMLSEFSGGTSTELFAKAFIENRDNPNIKAIIINADTPGGAVPGVPELSKLIYDSRSAKRIVTVVNPMMASAGLWIGSSAHEVVAIPSASDVGSLGVITMHRDSSERHAQAGDKFTIVQSVDFKSEGNPMEPLSESAKAHYQERVMSIHRDFASAVARNYGLSIDRVESEFGRGRTFRAQEAKDAGLVHRIATLDEVIEELSTSSTTRSQFAVAALPSTSTPEGKQMNAKIKAALVKTGLCKVTDDETAFTAALALHCDAEGVDATSEADILASFGPAKPNATTSTIETETTATTATINEGCMSQADFVAMVRVSSVPQDRQLEVISALTPKLSTMSMGQVLDHVNKESMKDQETAGHGGGVQVTQDSQDKFQAAARNSILQREMGTNTPDKIFDYRSGEYTDFKAGRQQYGLSSLPKLAEQCLVQAGIPYARVANLAPMHVAQLVMGANPSQLGLGGVLASSDGLGNNVSGMFSNILLDASNVLLRRSYDDARTTFQMWMRQAASLSDFKLVNKVIAGELGDPKAVPEDGEFEETTLSDGREAYKLTVWGSIFSHSWQLIVNDQLNSFTEVPAKMGRSMRRKQNRLAYSEVNDNRKLSDGKKLFDAAHKNRQTGVNADAAALKAKWAKMEVNMSEQKGLDADSGALNLEPRYIVIPPALDDLVSIALNSASLHEANPNVVNTKQGAYEKIKDAQMGASQGGSDTRYLLSADNMDVDTVEYAFLQGLEAPVIEQEVSFTSLSMKRRIYQAFAVKAIDYRGLQDDTGA